MRKRTAFFLAAAFFSVIFAGCSTDQTTTEKVEATSGATTNEQEQHISTLVNLQMEMIQTIRLNLEPVRDYENSMDDKLQEPAVEGSKRIANELRGIEIPAELNEDLQGDIKESIELLAIYFEERAATLKPEPDTTEMNEAFGAFHAQIGSTFEKAGLHAPNFEKDVY